MNRLLIAAMPSSGSDWFASCILAVSELQAHPTAKEPLNPICNIAHFDLIATAFGCEAANTIRRIAAPPRQDTVDHVLELAIPPEVNFVKEVWCGYQLEQLEDHFHIVTMTRSHANTFPPTRVRVYSWYLALARSIESNLHVDLPSTLIARITVAHEIYRSLLAAYPTTVTWEFLMTGTPKQLAVHFDSIQLNQFLDTQKLSTKIVETRQPRTSSTR